MAIYHLSVKNISRGKGGNAIAAAAYRRATKLFDKREGCYHNYLNKSGVIHSELTVPADSPQWVNDLVQIHEVDKSQAAENLWNDVEISERRKDARLAKEIVLALPIELNQEQNIALCRDFLTDQFALRGMIADWNVHWDEGNPHVHVMTTTRALTEEGFGKKVRAWNDKALIKDWRLNWSEYANFHLRMHQYDVRIDHRSYEAQGIDLVPSVHVGKAVTDMHRRGIHTQIMKEAKEVNAENLSRMAANPNILFNKMTTQRDTFSREQLGQELGRYVNDQGKFSTTQRGILAGKILADVKDLEDLVEKNSVLTPELIGTILNSLEHHDSVFSERDIAKALNTHTDNAEVFAKALLEIKASKALLYLGAGRDGRDRYTTRRMFKLENRIQKVADDLRERKHIRISSRLVKEVLDGYKNYKGGVLNPEQRIAVMHLTAQTSIACMVGRAGTGKSFTLGAAKAVWEKKGLRTLGVALSGVAADGLASVGIPSSTIESFRYSLQQGDLSLSRNDVLVMDEAGMSDSFSMDFILRVVKQSGAKLILCGDHGQLQPVGPGAVFRALIERLGFKELQTVHRQEEQWQRDATVAFSQGYIAEGLSAYQSHNCIHLEKTERDSALKLVQDWQETRLKSPKDISNYLVIAHRNEDVNLLNRMLREERVASREIEVGYSVGTSQGDISISIGDRLLFLKNDRRLGVKNGRFATVKSFELGESGRVLRFTVVLDDSGKEVVVHADKYKDFMHGYSATIHKTQGVTVDHSFVYASGFGWNRNLTYVAMTRHRYSCQLYADKSNFKDMTTLEKQFGRFALKDSLLDFPLGFAERRGIEVRNFGSFLVKCLVDLRDKLREKYDLSTNPEAYWRKRAEKIQELGIFEKARKVADYVDANQAVGKAWQELQSRLDRIGISEFTYEPNIFELISSTKEYENLQKMILTRNHIALDIVKDRVQYEDAITIHQLSVSKLNAQAKSYECHERLRNYAILSKQEKVVLRDRVAAEICKDMKGHYPFIIAQKMSANEIRTQGIAHKQRQRLIHLNPEERATFKVVETYQALGKKIGENWGEQVKQSSANKLIKRDDVLRLEELTQKREALAYEILSNRERYNKALNFYQFGVVTPLFSDEDGENQSDNAISKIEKIHKDAVARWFKLQQAAARYELRERVEKYHKALFVGDKVTRQALAFEILKDSKSHFAAIKNLGVNAREFMRVICEDAKKYERHKFLLKLDLVEKEAFERVEVYVDLKKNTSKIWREIFAAKSNMAESEDTLLEKFNSSFTAKARISESHRNILAATIFEDLTTHEGSLNYFGITSEELDKATYRHVCEVRVSEYVNCDNPYQKSKLAFEIISDPKAHYSSMVEKKLNWRQIYRDARIAEQEALFARLSKEEKILLRLASRYQKINREVGRYWSQLLKNKPEHTKFTQIPLKAESLLAKRDYYAEKLYSQKEKFEYIRLFEEQPVLEALTILEKNKRLMWGKIEKQASRHLTRISDVKDWKEAQEEASSLLKHLLNSLENASDDSSKNAIYSKWKISQENAIQLGSRLQKRFATYQYALRAEDYSHNRLSHVQDVAQKSLSSFTSKDFAAFSELSTHSGATKKNADVIDVDMQKRLDAVQTILRGTKPVHGTLAERYLREHRGIQGKINPEVFYFHPNLRNWVSGGYYPALVAVVRDKTDEKNIACGVQAIFLDPKTANKSTVLDKNSVKLSRGKVWMGAKVCEGTPEGKVAFAEGPETALSIADAHPDWTVFVTFGSANFDKTSLSANSSSIVICADNDGVGSSSQKSVEKAADKMAERGIDVWVTLPEIPSDKKKWDFNDLLMQKGIDAVRESLDKMKLLRSAKTIETFEEKISKVTKMKIFAQELDGAFIVSQPIKHIETKPKVVHITNPLNGLHSGNNGAGFNTLKSARSAQIQAWLQHYIKATNYTHSRPILIANDKKEAIVLNEKAHQNLVNKKLLETVWSINTPYGWRDLAVGGRIRFDKNYFEKGISSDMLGTIASVDRRSLHVDLSVTMDDGRKITFSLNDYSALDYGYALTIQQRLLQKENGNLGTAYMRVIKPTNKADLFNLLKAQREVKSYWLQTDFDNLDSIKSELISKDEVESKLIPREIKAVKKKIKHEVIQEIQKESNLKKESDLLTYLKESGASRGYELLTDAREAQVKTWLDKILVSDIHEHRLVGADDKEVKILNEKAHALFKRAVQIKSKFPVQTAYGWRDMGEGVPVRFGKEFSAQKVKADTLGVIKKVEDDTLTIRLEDGHSVSFKLNEYSDLDYGYAISLSMASLKPVKFPHVLITKAVNANLLKDLLAAEKEVQCYWRKIEFDGLKAIKKHLRCVFKAALNKVHEKEAPFESKVDYDFE